MITGCWNSRTGPIRVAERLAELQCRPWTVELRLTMAMWTLGTASGDEGSGDARRVWNRFLFGAWAPKDGPCRVMALAENAGQASSEYEVCRQRQCGARPRCPLQ